ncbi:MAG TPA: glucosidase, partial [bacterium]|nr:glucosidase [bacterium]
NFLLVESLERYHCFYGEDLKVECPTGSGHWMNLGEVARFIAQRLNGLFLPDEKGNRPCHGGDARFAADPAWKDLALFYEYFNGDNGKGLGASHQTGWTALVAKLLEGYP